MGLLRKGSSISSDQGLALVELFNQHLLLLKQLTADGRQLKNVLSGLPWLPRVLDRPNTYPNFMPWYDGDTVCCPNTMLPDSWSLLVGATVPIFKERLVSSEVRGIGDFLLFPVEFLSILRIDVKQDKRLSLERSLGSVCFYIQ